MAILPDEKSTIADMGGLPVIVDTRLPQAELVLANGRIFLNYWLDAPEIPRLSVDINGFF